MKIIEALKKTKDLARKADDIKQKISQYHADMDFEQPTYKTPEDQRKQIDEWLQAHSDIIKEIGKLKYQIQKTNVTHRVPIDMGGEIVTKSLYEWIDRRRSFATMERAAWDALNDKGLKNEGKVQKSDGNLITVSIRRYYDPKTRDKKREALSSEPSIVDGALEIANATLDLIEE